METISDRDISDLNISLSRFTLETYRWPCQILENVKNIHFPTGVGVKFSTILSVSSRSTTMTQN